MFPPANTDNVNKWLEDMLSSLTRAGLIANPEVVVDKIEDGKLSVLIRLHDSIPKSGWSPLRKYLEQYGKASGWRVEKIRQPRGALLFLASRA
jgi:hypothetical protein